MHKSVHQPIYPHTHTHTHTHTHQPTNPSTHLLDHPHLSTYPPIYENYAVTNHRTIHLSIYLTTLTQLHSKTTYLPI